MSRPALPADKVAYRPTRARPRPEFTGGRPVKPKHLTGAAAEEWKRLVRVLAERATLTRADAPVLELYVETYSAWRACCDEIRRDGPIVDVTVLDSSGEPHTVRKQSEATKMAAKLAAQMRQLLKEFGSTPASRENASPTKDGFRRKEPPKPGSVAYQLQEYEKEKEKNGTPTRPVVGRNREPQNPAAAGAGSPELRI